MKSRKAKTARTEDQRSPVGRILTDAMVLAAATAFAYALAFTYELGIANAFGIPAALIALDLVTILYAAGVLLGVFVMLFVVTHLLWGFIPKGDHPIAREARYLLSLLLIGYVFVYASGAGWKGFLVVLGILAFFGLWYFGWPLIFGHKGASYLERLKEVQKAENEVNRRSFIGMLDQHFSSYLLLFVVGMLVLSIAYILGQRDAKEQEDFFAIDISSNIVVLRIYGDNVISAQINARSNEIESPLIIQKLSSDSPLKLWKVHIGPLTLKKDLNQSENGNGHESSNLRKKE